jgi:hypothetical protein
MNANMHQLTVADAFLQDTKQWDVALMNGLVDVNSTVKALNTLLINVV